MKYNKLFSVMLVLSTSILLVPAALAVTESATSTVNATMAEQFNMPTGRTFSFNIDAISGSLNNYGSIQIDYINGANWSIESNKLEPVDISFSTTQEYTDSSGVTRPYMLLSGTTSRDTTDNNNYMNYAVSYLPCGATVPETIHLSGQSGDTGSGQIPAQNQLITTCQGVAVGDGPGELIVERMPTNISGTTIEPLGGSYTGQFTIEATQA